VIILTPALLATADVSIQAIAFLPVQMKCFSVKSVMLETVLALNAYTHAVLVLIHHTVSHALMDFSTMEPVLFNVLMNTTLTLLIRHAPHA